MLYLKDLKVFIGRDRNRRALWTGKGPSADVKGIVENLELLRIDTGVLHVSFGFDIKRGEDGERRLQNVV